MKKILYSLSIIVLIAGSISTTYGRATAKNHIKNNLVIQEIPKIKINPNDDYKESQRVFVSDYRKFLKSSEINININKKRLTEFKKMLSKLIQKDKSSIENKVSELEQTNANLKNKLASYKIKNGQAKWGAFKHKFNQDLADLEDQMWNIN